jgi:hypothetical protein
VKICPEIRPDSGTSGGLVTVNSSESIICAIGRQVFDLLTISLRSNIRYPMASGPVLKHCSIDCRAAGRRAKQCDVPPTSRAELVGGVAEQRSLLAERLRLKESLDIHCSRQT